MFEPMYLRNVEINVINENGSRWTIKVFRPVSRPAETMRVHAATSGLLVFRDSHDVSAMSASHTRRNATYEGSICVK